MASNTYTVKRGDTLSGIAQKYKDDYGFTNTYTYVNELVKINDFIVNLTTKVNQLSFNLK